MVKNIINLPINDRPYEKLELLGQSNLTNSELLAIVIKTGTKRLNCLQIAQNILKVNDNKKDMSDLEYLENLSLEELETYDGIGRVKAIQIKAVCELSKRMSIINFSKKDKITSPKDIFNAVYQSFAKEKQEILKTISLNKQNKIISIITNAIGGNDKIVISLKEILSEPIKQMASGIILVHNHPGGTLYPSKQDIEFTKNVYENSKIFNIELLDHIIIADNKYISLKEQKYI